VPEELVSSADEITVELVPAATDDVRALVGELDQLLSAEYTPEQRHGLALDAIFAPNIRFFVARLNGAAVGCGGVAFLADFAEVKRMYVREVARGRGVAQALLARIEEAARDAGFRCSGWRLERARLRRFASIRGPASKSARHLAATPQWHRRRSQPAFSSRGNSDHPTRDARLPADAFTPYGAKMFTVSYPLRPSWS
jgi:putative acetyltransferase